MRVRQKGKERRIPSGAVTLTSAVTKLATYSVRSLSRRSAFPRVWMQSSSCAGPSAAAPRITDTCAEQRARMLLENARICCKVGNVSNARKACGGRNGNPDAWDHVWRGGGGEFLTFSTTENGGAGSSVPVARDPRWNERGQTLIVGAVE